MSYGFPKCLRLLKSAEYRQVYDRGKKKVGASLQIFYFPNGSDRSRFGISVGRRFGNAVMRNRLKRRIREAIRRNKESNPSGLDIIIHPKLEALAQTAKSLESELQKLLLLLSSKKEIGIFEESHPDQP